MKKKNLSLKKIIFQYYILYTVIFIGITICIFFHFYINGKLFIWKKDGLFQHYNSLVYMGEYLRDSIRNLSFSTWDFKIGYGSDIITTLHYYILGDPLNLLSVFVPKAYGEWLYSGLILLRFYLAGISFSVFVRNKDCRGVGVLAGALIYTFCGYALIAGIRHPYFINPMIYFPLLLLGIEKIFKGKKPFLFIGMVFISAISNFYFFYMLTILSIIYAVVRFFFIFKKDVVKQLWKQLKSFFIYYLTGVLLASPIFLPVILAMFHGGRLGAGNAVPMLYESEYYIYLLTGFISTQWLGHWTVLGYTIIGLICALFLWFRQKKYGDIKILFLIFSIILILPAGGYILNGFSYVSNRWIWGYSFCISYIVTLMLPELLLIFTRKANKQSLKIGFQGLILAIIIINIILNATIKYASGLGNYISDFRDIGEPNERLIKNETAAVADTQDPDFYRYEEKYYNTEVNYNTSMQTGLNSTSFYFSLANSDIFEFFNQTLTNITKSFSYAGLDGRAYLSALACVKYFIVKDGDEAYLPYGYEEASGHFTGQDAQSFSAYKNKNVLPLGYTYDSTISTEDFDSLTAIEKQQALLQSVLIDDIGSTYNSNESLNFIDQNIDYKIELSNGVKKKDKSFVVDDTDAVVSFVFNGIPNSENYLHLQNLNYTGDNHQDISKIFIYTSNTTKSLNIRTEENQWYENRHDFLIQTGYRKDSQTKIELKFSKKGTYTFDQIEVVCQPMEQLDDLTLNLKEDVLEDININKNTISGHISLNTDKVLCLSIPFSTGWKAYVDGVETDLKRANLMYMAIGLTAGEHDIKLKYTTPGLTAGLTLFVLGIGLFVLIILNSRKFYKLTKPSE